MSSYTYFCEACGALRRRPRVPLQRDGRVSDHHPRCCGAPMSTLAKGYAEAATHLDASERVEWAARGRHIIRKPGRKWRAALSDRAIAAARDQFSRWKERSSAAFPAPRTRRP